MKLKSKPMQINLPVIVEKDEDGFYVAECPSLDGCYTQGKSLDEALKNIREVIQICLEEDDEDMASEIAGMHELSFHTVAVEV